MPAFNASTTMFETLDLVRNHTHARIEIIVVDDDSIDKTAPLDRKAAARAPYLQTDQCAGVNSSQGHPMSRLDSNAPPSAARLRQWRASRTAAAKPGIP